MAESIGSKQATSSGVSETTTNRGPASYGGYSGQSLANSLIGILTQQTQQLTSLDQARQQAVAQSDAAQQQSDAIGRDAAIQAGMVATQKAALNYTQNSALQRYQQELGLDPADAQNILSRSIAEKEGLRPQYEASRAEYDAAASTDLLSNPIGFIFAQLKLPSLAAKTNALADAMGRADVRMQVANEHLDTRRRTLVATSADQIREFELAQAAVDKKIADSKLKASEAATASKRAGELMQQMQVVNMVGDNQRQTIGQLATLRDQEENRVERRQRMALVEEQRKQLMDAKKAKDEDIARFDAGLAVVSSKLGLQTPVTYAEWSKLPEKEKALWHTAAKTGQFGDTLYDSIVFYNEKASRAGVAQQGNAASYDAFVKLRTSGLAHQAEAEREAMKTGKKIKPEEARARGFDIYADKLLNAAEGVNSTLDLASSKWDKDYIPYRAPTMQFAELANTDPRFAAFKNNEVVKAVNSIATATGARGQLTTAQEQAALGSIYEQVRTRKILPAKAAADIAAFYKAATDFNYAQTQYDLFGLPKQRAYMYSLEIGRNRIKTNLFNAAELDRAFQREVARDIKNAPTMFTDPLGSLPPMQR